VPKVNAGAAVLLALAAALAVLLVPASAGADETDACIQASDEGQVLRDQGRLLAARARFFACSREACPRIVRADCTAWLADADARIPTVVLGAQDVDGHDLAGVKVTLDGAPLADRLDGRAVPVDPGQHAFVFEHVSPAGRRSVALSALLREGELRRLLTARFPGPVPREEPRLRLTRGAVAAAAVLGGVAVTGGVLFAYLAATAKSDADHLRATCAPGCNPADVNAIRTRLIGANVLVGVGIASAAAGVAVLLWGPREKADAASVALVPRAGSLAVRVGF
jgi:hypothetical protein